MGQIVLLVVLSVVIFVAVFRATVIIQQSQWGVVERLGRFLRVLPPGFHVLLPFMDRVRLVPAFDKISVPSSPVSEVEIEIVAPEKALYEFASYREAVEKMFRHYLEREIQGGATVRVSAVDLDRIRSGALVALNAELEPKGLQIKSINLIKSS